MTPRQISTFRIDEEDLAALKAIYERDGILVPEQVRRAIKAWIKSKGAIKAERKRPASRKHS